MCDCEFCGIGVEDFMSEKKMKIVKKSAPAVDDSEKKNVTSELKFLG